MSDRECVSISLSKDMIGRIKAYREYDPEFNLSRRIEKLLDQNLSKQEGFVQEQANDHHDTENMQYDIGILRENMRNLNKMMRSYGHRRSDYK